MEDLIKWLKEDADFIEERKKKYEDILMKMIDEDIPCPLSLNDMKNIYKVMDVASVVLERTYNFNK